MYLTVVTWIQCLMDEDHKAEETFEREFFDVFLEQAILTLTSKTGSLYRSHKPWNSPCSQDTAASHWVKCDHMQVNSERGQHAFNQLTFEVLCLPPTYDSTTTRIVHQMQAQH